MDKPWFEKGLRFSCTECGACCTGSPGYVWITDEEIQKISEFLGLDIFDFQRKYIRLVFGRKALIEMKKDFDCVFLKDKRCSVYQVRPKQCRTFPWWQQNLSSESAWKEAANYCEGIKEDAPLIPYEDIKAVLES